MIKVWVSVHRHLEDIPRYGMVVLSKMVLQSPSAASAVTMPSDRDPVKERKIDDPEDVKAAEESRGGWIRS